MATVTYHVGRYDFDRAVALAVAAVLTLFLLGGAILANRSSLASDNLTPQQHYLDIEATGDLLPTGLSFDTQ